MNQVKEIFSDENLERTFVTSALATVGLVLLAPAIAPVAVTGMVVSQAAFWGKRIVPTTDK